MSEPLQVAPRPCESCPYRKDVPSGVWAASEYVKLLDYATTRDGMTPALATFHCHLENATGKPTACRGWLTVERESIAARLAVIDGRVTNEQRYAPVDVELWEDGAAACAHGLEDIECPSPESTAMAKKLIRRRAAR